MADSKDDSVTRSAALTRRALGGALLSAIPVGALACSKGAPKTEPPAPKATLAARPMVVRVASVPTAVEGHLLPNLIEAFQNATPFKVELTSSSFVYDLARSGTVDLAISHYGHKHAEEFVMGGYGEWPRTLFSNQMALLGPPEDPANVRGLQDAGEAFRRIAEKRAPFVVNSIDGVRYLTEILWHAADRPDRKGWLIDGGEAKVDAIRLASERKAYTLWGLTPFLRTSESAAPPRLEPLVTADPLLQRMLVSIIVKANKVGGANEAGAAALQAFLLSPSTQARIREVRYPGPGQIAWVPGGRHNRTGMLPKG